MKYVSRIVSKKPGVQMYSRYSNGVDGLKGRVVLMDTVSSGHSFVNINWGGLSGVAGLAYDEFDRCLAIVTHTRKTARLHEYIESISVQSGVVDCEDTIVLGQQRSIHFIKDKFEKICVNVVGRDIKLLGHHGSVVQLTENGARFPRLMTLYDFLAEISISTRINLARYPIIHFYNPGRSETTCIKFSQSAEADLYFLKMFVDIGGTVSNK